MPPLPPHPQDLREMVFAWWKKRRENDDPRQHLGASVLGRRCNREIWFMHRNADKREFEGRMLRLFEVGHQFEERMAEELREAIHMTVITRDDRTITKDNPEGDQYRVALWGGHLGGSMDGAILGHPDAPKAWHVAEFKTHNDKSFKDLKKQGVELAKYEHYCQMQIYMGLTGMDRALYIAENKNDSDLYFERVRFNRKVFDALVQRAESIVFAIAPPGRVSNIPEKDECRFCDYNWICHYGKPMMKSCRTCRYVRPDALGQWQCTLFNKELDFKSQLAACEQYDPIPLT